MTSDPDQPPRDWAMFFLRHERALASYAVHLCRGGGDAEDLVQRVLLNMIRRRVPPSVPLAYVMTAMRRAGHDSVRRGRSVRAGPLGAEPLARESAGGAPGEDAAALREAISRLPEEEHELLVLRAAGGLSLREAAAITGAPLGTVAGLHRRALQRLRGMLAPEAGEEVIRAAR